MENNIQRIKYFAIALGICAIMTISAYAQTNYYVAPTGNDGNDGSVGSPFATITKARDVVKGKTGNVNVYLRNGTYTQSATLTFDATCSGNGGNIVYQAYPGEQPIISGGQSITGWTVHDAAKNIYKATVGTREFRQLYINGIRAIRARTPNTDNMQRFDPYYCMSTTIGTNSMQVPSSQVSTSWGNLTDIEIPTYGTWNQDRYLITSISVNGGTATVNFKNQIAKWTCAQAYFGYYFENAYEFLDAPGEWYLDRKASPHVVYYKPRLYEDMTTAQISAPVLEQLVSFSAVNHIQFKGITFECTGWTAVSTTGFTDTQGTLQLDYGITPALPSLMELAGASYVRLEGCIIRHAGAQGIKFSGSTSNNVLINNLIQDISATGILMLGAGSNGDTIIHNRINKPSQEFRSACGLLWQNPKNLVCNNNEIWDMPYTGISTGWTWSAGGSLSNVTIAYNKIHDVMQILHDGGGIYSLGSHPNSHFTENYFYNINNETLYGRGGPAASSIFNDQGSNAMLETHNVFTTDAGGIRTCTGNNTYQANSTSGSQLVNCSNNFIDQSATVISNSGPQSPNNTMEPFRITSPLYKASFFNPASITITTNDKHCGIAVSRVDFYSGNIKIGQSTSAPFSMNWSNPPTLEPWVQYNFGIPRLTGITAIAQLSNGTTAMSDVAINNFKNLNATSVSGTVPGLDYKFSVINFAGYIKPLLLPSVSWSSTGVTTVNSLPPVSSTAEFVAELSGYIAIPTDGVYTFSLSAIGNDWEGDVVGAGFIVIDSVYVTTFGVEAVRGKIGLKAGRHRLLVYSYGEPNSTRPVSLCWQGPSGSGITAGAVPANMLTHGGTAEVIHKSFPAKLKDFSPGTRLHLFNLQGMLVGDYSVKQFKQNVGLFAYGAYVVKIGEANNMVSSRLAVVNK